MTGRRYTAVAARSVPPGSADLAIEWTREEHQERHFRGRHIAVLQGRRGLHVMAVGRTYTVPKKPRPVRITAKP